MTKTENDKLLIGLVDADLLNGGTRHPNLALLKLAGFLRDNKIPFRLITDTKADVTDYSRIYISKVFTFNPDPEFYLKAKGTVDEQKFHLGGTGYYAMEVKVKEFQKFRRTDMEQLDKDDFLCGLPNKRAGRNKMGINMASQMPYYDLYKDYIEQKVAEGRKSNYFDDYRYYSIGFLTRGCFRHCPFCVNKLEKKVLPYSKIDWFLDDEKAENGKLIRPRIYLWDDNFLASDPSVWRPLLQDLQKTGRPFQFRQGLDERILAESPYGEEIAETLSKCRYYGDYIFAFDNWNDRDKIVKALKIWKYYNPKRETKFYLFCGYRIKKISDDKLYTDVWEIFQRIKILMQYGCLGYIMRHEDYKNHPLCNIYVQIARWCNQPGFYRNMSFWEFCYKNQTFWEKTSLGIQHEKPVKQYEEFLEDEKAGYYNDKKICLPLQTVLNFLAKYPEHKEELLEMFNYRLRDLKNPQLWAR